MLQLLENTHTPSVTSHTRSKVIVRTRHPEIAQETRTNYQTTFHHSQSQIENNHPNPTHIYNTISSSDKHYIHYVWHSDITRIPAQSRIYGYLQLSTRQNT